MSIQTISLFRYLLLAMLDRKLFILITLLVVMAMFAGIFVADLAIINSDAIRLALIGDLLRYSMALLILLLVTNSVAEDYQTGQFERLLAMPLARWQYVLAQALVIVTLASFFALASLLIIGLYADWLLALYWAGAIWLEILLLGLLGFLTILSLERVPMAVILSLAIYAFAKLSGLIDAMLIESARYSQPSASADFVRFVFDSILYLIPSLSSFAENDVFFRDLDLWSIFSQQLSSVFVFSLFLLAACLVDFYRKEFNA